MVLICCPLGEDGRETELCKAGKMHGSPENCDPNRTLEIYLFIIIF